MIRCGQNPWILFRRHSHAGISNLLFLCLCVVLSFSTTLSGQVPSRYTLGGETFQASHGKGRSYIVVRHRQHPRQQRLAMVRVPEPLKIPLVPLWGDFDRKLFQGLVRGTAPTNERRIQSSPPIPLAFVVDVVFHEVDVSGAQQPLLDEPTAEVTWPPSTLFPYALGMGLFAVSPPLCFWVESGFWQIPRRGSEKIVIRPGIWNE